MPLAPQKTQKLIGAIVAVVCALGLLIGLRQSPIAEWSSIEIVDALVLVVFGLVGVYYAFRGGIYRSRLDLRRQRQWAWVALVGFSVLMLILIVADLSSWEVLDTFAVTTFVVILVIFVPQLIFLNRAMRQASPPSTP